ncbi:GNAT family N-acetyltransferase [Nonomuraea ferruginea]
MTATTLVGWFPAYDTEYARYSPGIVHHMQMAEAAAKSGLHIIDMGKGGKEYKDWLKSGTLYVAEGRVSRPTPSGGRPLDRPNSFQQGPNYRAGSAVSL